MKLRSLRPREKHTAILLLIAAGFNGFIQSFSQTQDIIARKALHAADWQILAMTLIWPISNLMSIWMGRIFERSEHKSRYFIAAGIFGRLVLVYGLFLAGVNEYLVILLLMYTANSILVPAQNSIFQKNIDGSRRAKVYGYTISLSMAFSVLITFTAGRLLDTHEQSFRWIMVATGIAGFFSCVMLSRIKVKEKRAHPREEALGFRARMKEPLTRSVALLKKNRQFAAFERSFSIYGMGFIMMTPVIPIFLVDILKLSYTANFLSKGILSQAGMLFLSPLLGKLHDRMHPFRFISLFFGVLMFFPLLIIVSSLFADQPVISTVLVFVAYLIFGLAMTGINIAWNMSSIFFAGTEDASMYQSVHVSMTGIRGLIAPVLGLVLMRTFGIKAVFFVAAGFLATASIVSYRDWRKLKQI